jgi:hypothetical protein
MEAQITQERAAKLVAFANDHDDGTPQPRAYFDEHLGAVIVKSTVVWPGGQTAVEHDSVRSVRELRAVLGY